jgi:hypothetical protein
MIDMTLKKLLELLRFIEERAAGEGIKLHGCRIWASGGELTLSFNTQPREALNGYLRRAGFISWEGDYIYRPRTKVKP